MAEQFHILLIIKWSQMSHFHAEMEWFLHTFARRNYNFLLSFCRYCDRMSEYLKIWKIRPKAFLRNKRQYSAKSTSKSTPKTWKLLKTHSKISIIFSIDIELGCHIKDEKWKICRHLQAELACICVIGHNAGSISHWKRSGVNKLTIC